MRRLAVLLLVAVTSFAANVRLYLKDGDFQLVREYQIMDDRVRYYSVERGDWEEIPLQLVDLARTKKEVESRQAALDAEVKADEEESAAIKAERLEVANIPEESGVYFIAGEGRLQALKQADITMVNDKKRTILKVLSPLPIIAGKSTAELAGETAAFRAPGTRPEFYFRQANPEGLAIVKLQPKKNGRLLENINKMPVSDELIEDRKTIPTFKKQIADQLFKIWPEENLEPGEYAVIEFTDGTANLQAWDFGVGSSKK